LFDSFTNLTLWLNGHEVVALFHFYYSLMTVGYAKDYVDELEAAHWTPFEYSLDLVARSHR